MWSHGLVQSLYHHRSRATDVRNSRDKLMIFCFVIGSRCEDFILFKMKHLHWYTKPFWQRELTSSFCWEEKMVGFCGGLVATEWTSKKLHAVGSHNDCWRGASRECNPWYADTTCRWIDCSLKKDHLEWQSVSLSTWSTFSRKPLRRVLLRKTLSSKTVMKDCLT